MKSPFPFPIKLLGLVALLLTLNSCDSTGQESAPEEAPINLDLEPIPDWNDQGPIAEPEPSPRDPLSPEQIEYNDQLDKEFEAKIPKKAWAAIKKYDPEFETWTSQDFSEYCGQPYLEEDGATGASGDTEGMQPYVPWGVIGDFNEDNKQDLALLGHNQDHDLILVAMRKESTYEIIEIAKYETLTAPAEYGLGYYMEFMENSYISIPYEDYGFPLNGDAFIIDHCNGLAILHYLEEGEFERFALTEGE